MFETKRLTTKAQKEAFLIADGWTLNPDTMLWEKGKSVETLASAYFVANRRKTERERNGMNKRALQEVRPREPGPKLSMAEIIEAARKAKADGHKLKMK